MGARTAEKGAASRQPGIKGVSGGDPASRKNGASREAEMLDESRAPEPG